MAFVTYDDLVTNIAAWLARSDLDARIPDFIRLAEARLQRELRAFLTRTGAFSLPVAAGTGLTSAIASVGLTPVEIQSCGWKVADAADTSGLVTPLPQVSLDQLMEWHTTSPGPGAPEAYAAVGTSFKVYPLPNTPKDSAGVDSFYTLVVSMIGLNASFGLPISAANYATNPVWQEHPDLYLYGALCEAAPYLQHDERTPLWEARFTKILRDIRIQDERLAFGTRPRFQPLSRVF